MSDPVKMELNRNAPQPMQVFVKGRIEAARTYENKRYTHIITPAADEYSRPQLVEIRSKQRLGEKGDLVSVVCVLGGYSRRPYENKDKKTGEIQTIVPVDHTLDLIETD